MSIQPPKIPPEAVIMRVISILGMGLTFTACVLLLVAGEWVFAVISAVIFIPFLLMMYVVDRMIPDPKPKKTIE